jgi:hypothetical protein
VRRPRAFVLGLLAIGGLALLLVTGAGWVLALCPRRLGRTQLLAAAPAAGIAVLVTGGVLADHVGVRLAGAAGAAIPLVLAALGWGMFLLVERRRRREEGGYSR